ncbi:hypothetical protein LFL96_23275 [Paraburkholderia sp. D15]|uniref:hypothetical protein n=1 Tax=Paraburkholderia sp. D15 TaxID=2880218 RepID=UPI00247ADAAF|nr:hypothetical protein [Paraburkholderia sp. D15]WGS53963.1 hypothetical protein LFL96_23275 [Paraburkholderia sp. D15]
MTVVTSYPGVYVEEIADGAMLSISAAKTAVPVFGAETWSYGVRRIASFFEYQTIRGSALSMDDAFDASIKAYFSNGGGVAYFMSVEDLAAEVPKYDDITLVVACGNYSTARAAIDGLCQAGANLFGIVDGPAAEIVSTFDPAQSYSSNPHMAVYYPYLSADWTSRDIFPSVVVAAIYCQNDRTRGVWSAPANLTLQGGLRPKFKITDDLQGQFNQGLAINMIRDFGAGPTVWGAHAGRQRQLALCAGAPFVRLDGARYRQRDAIDGVRAEQPAHLGARALGDR